MLAGRVSGFSPNHFIRLNKPARADILWWKLFVEEWNGISLAWISSLPDPDVCVVSDASGNWGCGAHWLPHWFFLEWTPRLQDKSIQVKELFPVVVAAAVFGKEWKGKVIKFVVDNKAVVEVLKSGYSKEAHLMHMV